jgi:TonB family protein
MESIKRGDGGTVTIALLVDESGKVADCSVIQTSGVAVLDAQTCAVMNVRAKFTPGVGENGKPKKIAFVQRITWRVQ